jgi:hypothetical protein
MMVSEKAQAAIGVLLKIAREERAALAEDLADVAAARRAAEASFEKLADDDNAPQDERALMRRRRLARTLAALEAAELAAREKLERARGLASRLETLTVSGAEVRPDRNRPYFSGAQRLAG